MNPDDAFTATAVKTAIENSGSFDRVLVAKRDGEFIFEAYPDGSVEDCFSQSRLEMFSDTYGATIDMKETSDGAEEYYELRMSGLIDNR